MLSVAPSAAPNVQLQNANTAELTTIGARQQQQFGNALGGAGNALEQLRYQALEEANALRTSDAINQYEEEKVRLKHDPKDGYTAFKGYDALDRQGGKPLTDEYIEKLDAVESRIASTLGNERQRQMFLTRTRPIRSQFMDGALQYESSQRQEYTLSVREAEAKRSANGVVLEAENPQSVALHTASLRASITGAVDPDTGVFMKGTAQLLGKSAAWANEKADEAVSGAHTGAIAKFMGMGNLNAAMAYRKRYGQQMSAADMLKIDGSLTQSYDTARGAVAGRAAVESMQPDLDPTEFDRLVGVVRGLESGTRGAFGADGKLLQGPMTRSGERAQGDMQVMPSTARDPGYGIKPADLTGTPQQQAAELARVGREKLSALIKLYNGDVPKAVGAYNWGEGNVNKAIKAAQANAGKGEPVPADAWIASAPKETRDYVTNVARQMRDRGTAGAPMPTAEQAVRQAQESLGPNASPWALKAATEGATQAYELKLKTVAQRKEESTALGYQAVLKAGGRWSEVDPGVQAQVARNAPEKLDEIRNFGTRIAKGDDVTDDRVFLRLTSNPQAMATMTDAQFYALRGGLSQSDFQHFTKQRADMIAGRGGESPGDLNSGSVNEVLKSRLQGLKINVKPKPGTDEEARFGAINRYVYASVIDAQRQAGKKFNDAEIAQHLDGLFARNVEFKTTFLGFTTSTAGQPMLSMKVSDIPGADADRIRSAFKAQGNSQPTNADVLGAYFAGKALNVRSATLPAQ